MWKRPDDPQQPAQPQPSTAATSPAARPAGGRSDAASLGASIRFTGEISGDEDLLVQGQVDGKIDLPRNHVTVGKHGRVKADIHGRVIDIQGDVEGNLFGDEQVVVRQSGSVRGNITAPRVTLEDGANFKGAIDMEPKPGRGESKAEGRGSAASGASSGAASGASGGASSPSPSKAGGDAKAQGGAPAKAGQQALPGGSRPGS